MRIAYTNAKMLKETETEETIVFFATFLSLVGFQLGGGGRAPCPPPGYAYQSYPILFRNLKIFDNL